VVISPVTMASGADPLTPLERDRSNFVRGLVQRREDALGTPSRYGRPTPKRIVQFWDDLERLPPDVENCMKSWRRMERAGFELEVFDRDAARSFISARLGARHEAAFDRCYHPSMMSDYFRYSYVLVEGGFYIDADDVYYDAPIGHLFEDGRLKLQPFCYDVPTGQMVEPTIFTEPGADRLGWIFYFNTTPLIAAPQHPIVERALLNATASLEAHSSNVLPEVQASTGPGNLTRSVFEVVSEARSSESLLVAHDWEMISTSKWPLSYRNDSRNWRLSNQQEYRAASSLEGR